MITPLLPVLLTATLGAGPAIVGLVEGVAEATASVLKVFSGRLADRGFGARRLVLGGYGASNLARPAIGLALGWTWVLGLRFLDRLGKGLRTAPRDAMIAAAVSPGLRGRAFGFHRAMDHAGAVLGPLLAFGRLAMGCSVTQVFAWSLVPGLVVLALIWKGLEPDEPAKPIRPPPIALRSLDPRLRGLIGAAGLLSLSALPEVLMVLWATSGGLPVTGVPLLWAAASLAKMAVVVPAGALTDRLGPVPVLLGGWSLRIVLLVGLAVTAPGATGIWAGFIAYSVALALTEAPERSLIGDAAPAALRGTAFGVYHLAIGLFALPGAVLLGLLWEHAGSRAAFLAAAGLTAVAAGLMLFSAGRPAGRTSG
jgi:MFS family permease